MKRWQAGGIALALAGVAACALAARWQLDLERAPRNSVGAVAASTNASAAPAAGRRANGSQPLVPFTQLRLTGEVVELASPQEAMTVTVRLGAREFPAEVSGRSYSVVLPAGDDAGMVSVAVESTRVHYASVLGSFGRLRTLAGADYRLDLAESSALRVSPYTTAMEFLVRTALNRLPTSDHEFELAVRSLYGDELEGAAYLMSSIASGARPLPYAYITGYGALHDPDYYRDLAYDPAFLAASKGYLDRQATQMPLASLDTLPDELAMVSALPFHELPKAVDKMFLFQRRHATSAAFYENTSLPYPEYNMGLLDDGVVHLVPLNPHANRFYRAQGDVYIDRFRVRYRLRRLFQGAEYSQWVVRLDWKEQVVTWNNTGAIETGSDYYVVNAVDMARWTRNEGWGNMRGKQVALPTPCQIPNLLTVEECTFTRQRFNLDGTGALIEPGNKVDETLALYGAPAVGAATTWNVDVAARTLTVDHEGLQTVYRKVDDSRDGVTPVVYLSRDTVYGNRRVGLSLQVPENTPNAGIVTAEGDWLADDYRSLPMNISDYPWQRRVQRDAQGNADYRLTVYDTWPTPTRYGWSLVNGAVLDRRTLPPCDQYTPLCYSKAIYFRPLLRAGNRYYGVREEYDHVLNRGNGQESTRTRSRAGFYDCLSGPCTGPNGLVDVQAPAAISAGSRAAISAPKAFQARSAYKGRAPVR